MPTECYHDGNFWQCNTTTTAAQSPTTHPAKWDKKTIPAPFRRYVIEAATAKMLPGEGKADLARSVAKDAEGILSNLVHSQALFTRQPTVGTR